jgi:hypothetical protein
MANVTERFGLRPSRQLNGSPFINAQNRYRVATDNSTNIYQGDVVIPFSSGTVGRAVANTSTPAVGVFNGCFYTDPTTQKPTWKNYLPSSVNASDIVAFVIDAPDTVFEVNANGVFAVADIFKNFSVNNVTGNIQTGISYVQLDVANSGTDSTYLVQAIDISGDVLNSDVTVSNANVLVRINNHFYKAATSGL